jgi:hypothetical protein
MGNRILKQMREYRRGFHLAALSEFVTLDFNLKHKRGSYAWCKQLVEKDPVTKKFPEPAKDRAHVLLRGNCYSVPRTWGVTKFMDLLKSKTICSGP